MKDILEIVKLRYIPESFGYKKQITDFSDGTREIKIISPDSGKPILKISLLDKNLEVKSETINDYLVFYRKNTNGEVAIDGVIDTKNDISIDIFSEVDTYNKYIELILDNDKSNENDKAKPLVKEINGYRVYYNIDAATKGVAITKVIDIEFDEYGAYSHEIDIYKNENVLTYFTYSILPFETSVDDIMLLLDGNYEENKNIEKLHNIVVSGLYYLPDHFCDIENYLKEQLIAQKNAVKVRIKPMPSTHDQILKLINTQTRIRKQ